MVLTERETARVTGRHLIAGAALLVAIALGTGSARAGLPEPRTAKEYAVKAAFLYSFANFVTWPAGEGEPDKQFVIGIVRTPSGNSLTELSAGKK